MLSRDTELAGGHDPVAVVPAGFSFLKSMLGVLSPDSPQIAGNFATKTKSAANDNVFWVGDEDGDGNGGVFGSDVDAASLADGSSVVAWIGPDRIVHAKYYPADGDTQGAGADDAGHAARNGQINDLLSDLGGAGQRAGNADGRVKVTSFGQNGVAALWIADFGFTAALMGKLYLLQQEPGGDAGTESQTTRSAVWTVKDFSPVAVPRFASNISVDVTDDGQISVSYSSEPGDGGSVFSVSTGTGVAAGDEGSGELIGSDEGDVLAPDGEALDLQVPQGSSAPVKFSGGNSEAVSVTGEGSQAASGAAGAPGDRDSSENKDGAMPSPGSNLLGSTAEFEITGTPITVAGGLGDTVQQTQPQVVVTPGGTIVPLHVEPGVEPGTAVIKLTPLASNGQPVTNANGEAVVTVVTDHAVVHDEEQPHLELGPSLAVVGEGVGVAFLTESSEGGATAYQLNVQVFDGQGSAISDTPVVVAMASDLETTYSDFDVGGVSGGHGHGGDDTTEASQDSAGDTAGATNVGEPGGSGVQLAVVWVENANESGYGSIMGQRFGVMHRDDEDDGDSNSGSDNGDHSGSGSPDGDSGGGQVLVALGIDGTAKTGSADGDSAFHVPSEDTGDVVGRAPQVSGCGDDEIAIAWVQETSPGSGIEVVAGTVLQAHGGSSVLAINLSGLISNGILHGTEPTLLSDDNGDIVIGWVQAGNLGQYEAAVAVYRALEAGGWSVPDAAHILRTFDSEPNNLDFGLQGGSDPTILLSWSSSGSRVSGARYDLDGNQEGSVFRIRGDDGDNGSDSEISVAGLADGHIVVVYTQTDGNDTDIGAMIVQTAPSSGPDSASNDSAPESGSSAMAIVVASPSASGTSETTANDSGSGAAQSLVVVDLESDFIRVYDIAGFDSLSSPSGSGGSNNDNSGSGRGEDVSGETVRLDDNSERDGDDDRDSGNSGSGSSGSGKDVYDNLSFAVGYGNDAADYYEDEHEFDVSDPVADMFDALQFANALSESGNGEVIVFEASNVVVIRDFEIL